VLASIIEARDRSAFTTETLAIASAVAHLLVAVGDGDVVGAASIASLSALLPKPRAPETADLAKLSDSEFNILAGLLAKARSTSFEPLPKRRRSLRVRDALRFVATLDRVAARIAAGAEPHHETATEFERNELRSHVNILLSGLNGTAADILGYPPAVMDHAHAPLPPPPVEEAPASPPAQHDNVVRLPNTSWAMLNDGGSVAPGVSSGPEYQ
jgi:hypothetical protein